MITKKDVGLIVGVTILIYFTFILGPDLYTEREAKNHRIYISSLPEEGKTYVIRPGDVIPLPDGTGIRFVEFYDGVPSFLVNSYLYFPKDNLKLGEYSRYYGDLVDLRGKLCRAPSINLPFVLHILSADGDSIIYRISKNE